MEDRRSQNPALAARIGAAPKENRRRAPSKPARAFAPFEWMIALRYLRSRRAEGFVSVISGFSLVGIALGVATLIIVMAVMNGFRHELLGKILGLNGHILVNGPAGGLPDYDEIAKRVRGVPGITRAAPIVDGQVMASANGGNLGVIVRGISTPNLKSLNSVSSTLSKGALDNFNSGDEVIVGYRLAAKLRLVPGEQITLIAPKGNVTPFGTTPRVKSYTIAGTFRIGMSEYDSTFIFMPLKEAQLYFNMGDTVSALEVMVSNPDNINSFVGPVADAAGPYARVSSWEDVNSTLFSALEVERNVMFLILTLIILVAALNIISGLIMLVKDKSGDIAILRTMGATRGAVMRIFFISGASIGVIGTLLGFVIGVLFCSNIETIRQFLSSLMGTELFNPEIYFLSHMPAKMETDEVISVVLMALGLSFLATLYPSWRAAKLDPVEALRYE
ncbi:MAG: lipoprotein-releasing ABC transporter permease subunit [Alphaproteobacteria bacterium]|nr:lipoprotein-releasing ABC transporter permease subunit [Alphaproteobacteria bacterium]